LKKENIKPREEYIICNNHNQREGRTRGGWHGKQARTREREKKTANNKPWNMCVYKSV
jgi:hypothetical protein